MVKHYFIILLANIFMSIATANENLNVADPNASKKVDFATVTAQIAQEAEQVLTKYQTKAEDAIDSADAFSDIYFETFEGSGMETAIGMRDTQRKVEIEAYFSEVIGLMSRSKPYKDVEIAWQQLHQSLIKVTQDYQPIKSHNANNFTLLLVLSAVLLLALLSLLYVFIIIPRNRNKNLA